MAVTAGQPILCPDQVEDASTMHLTRTKLMGMGEATFTNTPGSTPRYAFPINQQQPLAKENTCIVGETVKMIDAAIDQGSRIQSGGDTTKGPSYLSPLVSVQAVWYDAVVLLLYGEACYPVMNEASQEYGLSTILWECTVLWGKLVYQVVCDCLRRPLQCP